jgi:hypothetical protein
MCWSIVSGRTKSHELESLLPWNGQPSKAASTGKHPALAGRATADRKVATALKGVRAFLVVELS